MSEQELPVSVQKAGIRDEINSTILNIFLWGIYSVVYIVTLYLYSTKKSSGSRLIVGAITLSYLAYSISVILFWYYDQSAVVNNSETREALFAALEESGPTWPAFVDTFMTFILACVADGILIWRCYNVWGRSLLWISVPLFLLFCEIVIDLAVLILQCAQHLNVSASQAVLDNQLYTAQAFITFTTTLTSTALVAYRIYRTSMEDIPQNSRGRFKRIIEILVQSAALYSLAAIAQAIPNVIPETLRNVASVDAARDYTEALFGFISGTAPTILAARVATLDDKDTYSSNNLSTPGSIQFHVRSTAQAGSQLSDDNSRPARESRGAIDISDNVNPSAEVSKV